jgi:phosphoglycolate phosphatase
MVASPNIVFDLDGTLVDSAPSLCKTGNYLLELLHRPPIDVKTYRTFIGKGLLKQVEQLLIYTGGIPHSDLKKHLLLFSEHYDQNPLVETTVYIGVSETLQYLKSLPSQLAICTQKAQNPARTVLSGFDLEQYFDGFTFGDTLSVMKPNLETVLHSIKDFDNGPLIYIGDSETDSITAKNSNAFFLLFAGGYRNSPLAEIDHYATFESHSEIPDLVDRILSEF